MSPASTRQSAGPPMRYVVKRRIGSSHLASGRAFFSSAFQAGAACTLAEILTPAVDGYKGGSDGRSRIGRIPAMLLQIVVAACVGVSVEIVFTAIDEFRKT